MRSSRDFFIGVLTGATIGLLSAPRTGRETRQWLKSEYEKRAGSSGSSGGPGLKEQLTNAFEQIKGWISKYQQEKQGHEQRLSDTGHFAYQRDRDQQLRSSVPNSEEVLSSAGTGTSGLPEHRSQIIPE